jgi:glycosyltransferase involved in cell wall biosynthesis
MKYIEKMLISIVNQTYKNLEVIISDNCSTDNSYEFLQKFAEGRPNWTVTQNKKNIGAINNMDRLIKLATGEYTAIYHADDLYEPTIVEKSVTVFEKDKSVSLVSTLGYSIDADDEIFSTFQMPRAFENKKSVPFNDVFLEILSQKSVFLITPSIMTRTVYYKNRTFPAKYSSAADYGMWFELMQEGNLHIINENLIKYRTHDKQGSQLEIKENCKIPDSIAVYKDYAEKDKKQYWKKFQYTYYKLILVQAIKLNNLGDYKKSRIFLALINRYTNFYLNPVFNLLLACNLLHLKLSLNKLLSIKTFLKGQHKLSPKIFI